MKNRQPSHCLLWLSLLTAPLLADAQQAPPAIKGHPLYGAAAQAQAVPAPVPSSIDPRLLGLAPRLKTVVGQVREPNPAVLPESIASPGAGARLQQRATGKVEIRMRHNTGTPRSIEGAELEGAAATTAGTSPSEQGLATARNFLRANKELLRLSDPDREMVLQKSTADELDRQHLRFAQMHEGIRVWPGELTVHLSRTGSVYLMTGAYVATPRVARTGPTITADEAIARARVYVQNGVNGAPNQPELIIYAPGERTPRLAWKLELELSLAEDWLVVVDAETGRVLTGFNQVMTGNVQGSGIDLFGQTRPLNVWEGGGTHVLCDTSKPMFDPTSTPPNIDATRGGIVTVDARNEPSNNNNTIPPLFHVASTNPNGFTLPAGVSGAFSAAQAYDYFQQVHNRKSFDGNGKTFPVVVRYGSQFNNAFFNHDVPIMALGDADTWAASVDFVAHELAHGVTGTSAGLIYQFQSGALNESFSDIFGEMVEFRTFGSNDWKLGSGLTNILRDMANPGSLNSGFGGPYPSKMSQFFNLTLQQDQGGVHINSSIFNRCFYLVTEGLQGGIGRPDAERIFYRALTVYLMANSQFVDARIACIRAARDLFGENSIQAQRVASAFDAVEIFDSQPTPPSPEITPVAGADSTLFLYGNSSSGFLLARREAAQNDPEQGTFLGDNYASQRPSAVTGAGDIGVYVTADNDIALFRTDGGAEQKLGFSGQIHSVGMAPDGDRFAFVFRDQNGNPDNHIGTIRLSDNTTQVYELRAPTNDGGSIATVLYADIMTFTGSGRYLIYDALNEITQANGARLSAFSIYALDLQTGAINSLVAPVEGFNIGNPSLSRTNDGFMAFEAIGQNGTSTMLTIDLNSGAAKVVGSSFTLGYPKYTGDDDAVIYAEADSRTFTGTSLVRQAVAQDRLTPTGDRTLWLFDANYHFMYRRGAFQGPPDTSPITRLANISTRMRVLTGERVLIAGFIITGSEPKKVIIRGIGPSLSGVAGTLPNPFLRLRQGGTTLAENDNWKQNQAEVEATTIPPRHDLESAIVTTLNPGTYTAVLEGTSGGTGVGLVEVYDLAPGAPSKLANISTRGFVDTGDNVMIGGLIVTQGADAGTAKVLVRALGPSLSGSGIQGPLQDPTLELRNANGTTTASNDNWKTRPDGSSQQADIQATTIPPSDDRESAVVSTLVPGNYTAILRGSGNSTGVGLVEFYNIQ